MVIFDKTKHTTWYVNKKGEVFSESSYLRKKKKHKYKISKSKRGYIYARTTNGNYQVHRLVASAYIPNPYNKPQVNHKDGNKLNNHVSNLEWVTPKENAIHAMENGLTNFMKKNEGKIKYSNKICREVLLLIRKGMKYKDAGNVYGMPYSTVAHLVRGSRRKV